MKISSRYVLVEKLRQPPQDGDFNVIEAQDDYVYKGKVVALPEVPVHVDNALIAVGDVVLFAKYSPDTHEIDIGAVKMKFVAVVDLLAVV